MKVGTELESIPFLTTFDQAFSEINSPNNNDQITIILIIRRGEPESYKTQKLFEMAVYHLTNEKQQGEDDESGFSFFCLDSIEVPLFHQHFDLKSVPIFAAFHHSKPIYIGNFGGCISLLRPVAIQPSPSSTSSSLGTVMRKSHFFILLLEPNIHDQILIEKALKRRRIKGSSGITCEWNLCLDGQAASSYLMAHGGRVDVLLVSEDCSESDLRTVSSSLSSSSSSNILVSGLVSLLGEEGKRRREQMVWSEGVSEEISKLQSGNSSNSQQLQNISSLLVGKPFHHKTLDSIAIHYNSAFSLALDSSNDHHLTFERLGEEIEKLKEKKGTNLENEENGITMSIS